MNQTRPGPDQDQNRIKPGAGSDRFPNSFQYLTIRTGTRPDADPAQCQNRYGNIRTGMNSVQNDTEQRRELQQTGFR